MDTIVINCKNCGALFYAVSKPNAEDVLEIARYAGLGHKVSVMDAIVHPVRMEQCNCAKKVADVPEWEIRLESGDVQRERQRRVYEHDGRLVFVNEDEDHVGGVAAGKWIWFHRAEPTRESTQLVFTPGMTDSEFMTELREA